MPDHDECARTAADEDKPTREAYLAAPTLLCAFVEFPKITRLSRDCIITGLTSSAFSPYCKCESNAAKASHQETKAGSKNPLAEMGGCKQRKAERTNPRLSRPQVCSGRSLAGRRSKGCRSQGVDGGVEIQAMHRLRRHFPDMLHGFRPSQGREEGSQHRQYVRESLQPRTHSNRSGQMRLGLRQLSQNTNP